MLALPRRIERSVSSHISDLAVFCDWLESTVMFDDLRVSQGDVVDFLCEQEIYDDNNPDFCMDFVTSAWREVRRRLRWIGSGSPLQVKDQRIVRVREWRAAPAHAFCLVLGLAPYYEEWVPQFGHDYTKQGELFEKLVAASVCRLFHEWKLIRTGWSRNKTSSLSEVVNVLANEIHEEIGNVKKYGGQKAKECGLDIFWHRPFPDARGGHPVFLGQCASGANWSQKLHTPEDSVWRKLVDWKFPPSRAFAVPFALSDGDFARRCNQFSGLFLDRYRILIPAARDSKWLPDDLAAEINGWVEPRVNWILSLSSE